LAAESCEILFVCFGNMCRSPMAEGILKNLLSRNGISNIHVQSAGLMASNGMHVAKMAEIAAGEHDISLETHTSRLINKDILNHADLVLVMEKIQQEAIKDVFPEESKKIFLLGSFGKDASGMDVDDPIGGSQELFDLCFQRIESEIQRILPGLMDWCGNKQKRNRHSHEK
jgi:protein-tyrosine-phosphatase